MPNEGGNVTSWAGQNYPAELHVPANACSAIGGIYRKSWYVSIYGRTCNEIRSMKILSHFPGNAATSFSGSMKILGCYMGNRLTAIYNSYVCR